MPFDPVYLIYGAVALAAVLFIEGVFYLVADARGGTQSINRRLRMLSGGRSSKEVLVQLKRSQQRATGALAPIAKLNAMLMQAGMQVSALRFLLIMAGLAAAAYLGISVVLQKHWMLGGGAALLLGGVLPLLLISLRRRLRIKRFGEQLPDTIEVIVRSLRAGHPIATAIGMAAKEMGDPMGTEIGIAHDEMTYGLDLHSALMNMSERVGQEDFRYLVIAVSIQSQVGGNLAEVLSNLARVIRERFRLRRKIKALSAEGRMSAVVLSIMPFVIAGIIYLLHPPYFTDVSGHPLFIPAFGFAVVLMIVGDYIMYRMVNFRV